MKKEKEPKPNVYCTIRINGKKKKYHILMWELYFGIEVSSGYIVNLVEKNRERTKEIDKLYRQRHREEVIARDRDKYRRNRDKILAQKRQKHQEKKHEASNH